jgi:hypothetical protein
MTLNSKGSILFCGDTDGRIILRQAWDLTELSIPLEFQDHGAITSLLLHAGHFFHFLLLLISLR